MNLIDTARVIAKIAVFWPVDAGDRDVLAAWHEVIGDLAVADCLDAVTMVARRSRDWCRPADIRSVVTDRRRGRLDRCADLLRPNTEPEMTGDGDHPGAPSREAVEAWREEMAELRRRVGDGEWERTRLLAYRRSGLSMAGFDARPALAAVPPHRAEARQ